MLALQDAQGLAADCGALGLQPSPRQLHQLQRFCGEIIKWNRSFNLVSRQDVQRLQTRHVLDSLTGCGLLTGERILDLGSGAGFPGVPLAIMRPQQTFTLCDRSARRTRFLHHVKTVLGLRNVSVVCEDVTASTAWGHSFDCVTARGVSSVATIWALLHEHLTADGSMLVYASTAEQSQLEVIEPMPGVRCVTHAFEVGRATHTIVQLTCG